MTSLDSMAINAEAPTKVVLINPATDTPIRDKDGKEAYVMVLGTDSKAATDHRREATKRQLAKRDRTKTTVEEIEENAIALLAALTKGWYLVNFAGESIDYPFSVENARKLYANSSFAWVKDQVDAAAGDRANFIQAGSSTMSESGQSSSSL